MNNRYLITGGASGLGRSLAFALSERQIPNLKICVADLNAERGEETISELSKCGVEAIYQHCDITKIDDITALYQRLEKEWQGVDVVINNAGVATGGSLQSESIEQWQWIFDVNVLGMVRVSQIFLEGFKNQGHGYFVNIASQAGLTPIPLMSSYNAMKSAVIALSETMKLELAQYNVDVSVVCPSFFKTNLEETFRTTEPNVSKLMGKLFKRATLNSDQIAKSIVDQMKSKQFLILTHSQGKKAYRLKKYLPSAWYIAMMLKQTAPLLKQAQVKEK